MAVRLTELDSDFISPSQACVNPLFTNPSKNELKGAAKISIGLDFDDIGKRDEEVRPNLIKTAQTEGRKVAQVSLHDCLACSGCVTSAEAVLVQQQGVANLLQAIAAGKFVVATLSMPSLASIAVYFDAPMATTHHKLCNYLKTLGVSMIGDAAVAADVALIEAREEFIYRYQNRVEAGWKAPPVSVAQSSTRSNYPANDESSDNINTPCLPMLASSCPGWVCYAEKTVPQVIPYIATTKSPQQVAGVVLKSIIAARKGVNANDLFHTTIMPCADKKLEGARLDFMHEDWDASEVDLVLTSSELLQLMEKSADDANVSVDQYFGNLSSEVRFADEWEAMLSMCDSDGNLVSSGSVYGNAGSGGWLEHIFRYASKQLFGVDLGSAPLNYVHGRNADLQEVTLEVEGTEVLRFARAYGFRNIQNVTNKMKRKGTSNRPLYDYVELMACPSGCVNGGGQIRVANEGPEANRQRNTKTNAVLHEPQPRDITDGPLVQYLYREVLEAPRSASAIELLHTRYHNVPRLEDVVPETAPW